MMINMIQLKQVLRNKRFLLFTIFIPVTWYIFLYNIQQGIVPNIMLGIAVFIGIIGNSLVNEFPQILVFTLLNQSSQNIV